MLRALVNGFKLPLQVPSLAAARAAPHRALPCQLVVGAGLCGKHPSLCSAVRGAGVCTAVPAQRLPSLQRRKH